MVIVQINYRRPDMPKAEWEARYTDDRARQFLSVPGLLWKIWLDGSDERRAGGVYMFEDRAAAEATPPARSSRASGTTRTCRRWTSASSTCASG